jgi:hypothetical protein
MTGLGVSCKTMSLSPIASEFQSAVVRLACEGGSVAPLVRGLSSCSIGVTSLRSHSTTSRPQGTDPVFGAQTIRVDVRSATRAIERFGHLDLQPQRKVLLRLPRAQVVQDGRERTRLFHPVPLRILDTQFA